MRVSRFAIIAMLSLSVAAAARPGHGQAPVGYFGDSHNPVRATIGHAYELPQEGSAATSPVNFAMLEWFDGDAGEHPSACLVLLDGFGQTLGSPLVEVDAQLVYNSLYQAWTAGTAPYHSPGFHFSPGSPPACLNLLTSGQCVLVSGHITAAPDMMGQTWVADSFAPCP